MLKKERDKEELQKLCGPRLQLKIDRMLTDYNHSAGLDDNGNKPNERQYVEEMMQTGNTSFFKKEMHKNTNEEGYVPYVQAYGDDIKASIAFYEKVKRAKDPKYAE